MAETSELYRPGLEGVIAGETTISTVAQDSLAYRGYMIEELADNASFEEVAYLLLYDDLPTAAQLNTFKAELDEQRKLPAPVVDAIKSMPSTVEGMDMLRSGVSMLGHFDVANGEGAKAFRARAVHVLAAVPTMIAARMRLLAGKELIDPKPGLSHAAQFMYQAFGRQPTELEERIINLTLILYAEHEFNASTFAARVCASTLSDLYSAVVAGIGTLKGPLHGGANEAAIKLINQFTSADEAKAWTEHAVANKVKVMGFGHRVYKHGDHRARILEKYVDHLGKERDQQWRVDIYYAIKNVVWERKQIHPNVDYPCGIVYFLLDLPTDIYTPLFVASRVSGWCAHIIEQHENNRLIRPRSRYTGPQMRAYKPTAQR